MAYARTYNIFRNRQDADIFCAVCEDQPVPRFVDGKVWAYQGSINDDATLPAGFLPHLARTASDFNGFYLFFRCGRRLPALGKKLSVRRPVLGKLAA